MLRRIQITILILTSCFGSALRAQANADSLMLYYYKKMSTYLMKENSVSDLFPFDKEGIQVHAPETDSSEQQLEFTLRWSEIPKFLQQNETMSSKAIYDYYLAREQGKVKEKAASKKTKTKKKDNKQSLKDVRIALDPGHVAGDLETAKMERKYVEMKAAPPGSEIIEGKLTLATALILKKKLEKRGAVVMLTRDKPNASAFGLDYKTWKERMFLSSLDSAYKNGYITFEDRNYLRTKASDKDIFKIFFVQEDIRERAKKINAFKPDLTLIIHYNVDETNLNWNKPTQKNYNMAFVGGCFGESELEQPEDRIDFLRLLLSEDIKNSADFSNSIVKSLTQNTKVPSALEKDAQYLSENCLSTSYTGVFSRNLALTRKIKGTICYGESLYQDNLYECKELCKEDISIEGVVTSGRVEEVANAYYEGIMDYLRNRKK